MLQREGRHKRVANIGQIPATYDPLRAAFYVSWDPNSLASLKKHYKDIDLLMPEQLHAISPDGAMTIVDYQRNQQLVVKASPAEAIARLNQDQLHQWMRSVNPPTRASHDGIAEQLRRHGLAGKRACGTFGKSHRPPSPGQTMWSTMP